MLGPLSGLGSLPPSTIAAPAAAMSVPAASAAFGVDLASGSDFVAQSNLVQCVGASMQMMLNIMGPVVDRSARTQGRLQVLARSLSGPARPGFTRKGASVTGWTAGLNQLDAGPYRLVGATTLDEALRLAAASIRETGKPVGILVWAGRHAWVMSGFRATADPRRTSDFRVTAAVVLDPLYRTDRPNGARARSRARPSARRSSANSLFPAGTERGPAPRPAPTAPRSRPWLDAT